MRIGHRPCAGAISSSGGRVFGHYGRVRVFGAGVGQHCRLFCVAGRTSSSISFAGGWQLAFWLVAYYYAGILCGFVDICVGLYSCHGWGTAVGFFGFGPAMDAGTGRVLCRPHTDIVGGAFRLVQPYGSTFYGIYHHRGEQPCLCAFRVGRLVWLFPPTAQNSTTPAWRGGGCRGGGLSLVFVSSFSEAVAKGQAHWS